MSDLQKQESAEPKVRGPKTWGRDHWLMVLTLAPLLAPIGAFHPREVRYSPGMQIIYGVALIEIALFVHVVVYPETIFGPISIVAGIAADLWGLLPVVYWQPWQITSSALFVGLVPLANGLRVAFLS